MELRRLQFLALVLVLGCASNLGTITDKNPDITGTPTGTPTGSGTPPTPTPPPNAIVFVSSTTYQGNDIQTPIGGDSFCTTVAGAAGFGGIWGAWLSNGTFDAIDRINDVGPWYRFDGTEVFANLAAITSGPAVPITQDEHGNDLGNVEVWTGTAADGTSQGDDCGNWTTNGGQGHYGVSSATDATWTASTSGNCSGQRHLYCFLNE